MMYNLVQIEDSTFQWRKKNYSGSWKVVKKIVNLGFSKFGVWSLNAT